MLDLNEIQNNPAITSATRESARWKANTIIKLLAELEEMRERVEYGGRLESCAVWNVVKGNCDCGCDDLRLKLLRNRRAARAAEAKPCDAVEKGM